MTWNATEITEKTPLLRIHAFRLMFTTRMASHTANQFLAIAIAWEIWKITDSALHLGLVGLGALPSVRAPGRHRTTCCT